MAISQFEQYYRQEIIPQLMKEFGYKNVMQVPKLSKIVVNTCISEATQNVKALDVAAVELGQITGQKPVITKAKKSIATFKLREGQPIGAAVTLRRKKMYEFLNSSRPFGSKP